MSKVLQILETPISHNRQSIDQKLMNLGYHVDSSPKMAAGAAIGSVVSYHNPQTNFKYVFISTQGWKFEQPGGMSTRFKNTSEVLDHIKQFHVGYVETDHYKIHNTIRQGGGVIKNTTGIKAICSHCGKMMQSQIAHRWHMDNCKKKSDGGST